LEVTDLSCKKPLVKYREKFSDIDLIDFANSGLSLRWANLFKSRGLNSSIEALIKYNLLPFDELFGIDLLTDLLVDSINKNDLIVVVADYDCDGATSCAIAVSGLSKLGAKVDFFVPNRFKHGYGLTVGVIDDVLLKFPDVKCIITVDNGIASNVGVDYAKSKNIKVLITDHHLQGDSLPNADAIVNPNQRICKFQSKNLAGCGVIFYVIAALRNKLFKLGKFKSPPNILDLLDYVALGTVADVVKLDNNNRWLVKAGLDRIRAGKVHPGIQALFDVAGKCIYTAKAQDFGFAIAPRINAAGRLEDMSLGIRCLLEKDYHVALVLANQLDKINSQRKNIEKDMKEEAFEQIIISSNTKYSQVLYHDSFHEGVIGIVAGRIKELHHCPTIVFSSAAEKDILKGSGRSIPEVHLRDALDVIFKTRPDIIVKFGGHSMAAGVTIYKDKLADFQILFDNIVYDFLPEKGAEKEIWIDDILPVEEITLSFAEEIERVVWGQGFQEPIWFGEFNILESKLIGSEQNHLKMVLEKNGAIFDALHFFNSNIPCAKSVNMAYRLATNEFRGEVKLQLMVVEIF